MRHINKEEYNENSDFSSDNEESDGFMTADDEESSNEYCQKDSKEEKFLKPLLNYKVSYISSLF